MTIYGTKKKEHGGLEVKRAKDNTKQSEEENTDGYPQPSGGGFHADLGYFVGRMPDPASCPVYFPTQVVDQTDLFINLVVYGKSDLLLPINALSQNIQQLILVFYFLLLEVKDAAAIQVSRFICFLCLPPSGCWLLGIRAHSPQQGVPFVFVVGHVGHLTHG